LGRLIAVAAAAALVLSAAAADASPDQVVHGDYRIGGFAVKADGSLRGLVREFGTPTGLWHNNLGCVARWRRAGLLVRLYNLSGNDPCTLDEGRFYDATMTGRGWRTSLGLRVGDRGSRVGRIFPRAEAHGRWRWLVVRLTRTGTATRYPGLAARVVNGRVDALRVTFFADGD
jgi:hypothetical protein